jgi:2-polyprenyl-6-methoxyphenol hydroxylase-like FAD-dependent oxidoreductase
MRHGRTDDAPVLVAGGGIGGLAVALALARQGLRVRVLEQPHEIGEIGAGIQLVPNAFAAFDALGVGERARDGPDLPRQGCGAPRAQRVVQGSLAATILRRSRMAVRGWNPEHCLDGAAAAPNPQEPS